MESAMPANVERIQFERALKLHLSAWQRFAYAETASGLAHLSRPRDANAIGRWQRLLALSQSFDAWDRFDHGTALEILDQYRPVIGKHYVSYFQALKSLTSDSARQEPMRLFDLWRNAERRALQGRYDDAVARVYRLLEWTAQWLLRSQCDIDTSNAPSEGIPESISVFVNSDGKRQLGLFSAWQLIAHHMQGPAAEFIATQGNRLRHQLEIRNYSILAHGFAPIDESGWHQWAVWIEEALLPVLQYEARKVGIKELPPQLPMAPPG
jgi:CRISPR-associated protein (TIGR02710 family)